MSCKGRLHDIPRTVHQDFLRNQMHTLVLQVMSLGHPRDRAKGCPQDSGTYEGPARDVRQTSCRTSHGHIPRQFPGQNIWTSSGFFHVRRSCKGYPWDIPGTHPEGIPGTGQTDVLGIHSVTSMGRPKVSQGMSIGPPMDVPMLMGTHLLPTS